MRIKNSFSPTNGVWFKETDIKKIRMMDFEKPLYIISNVCPDYSNNGQTYTFSGVLGSGISLTALEHLANVPALIENFQGERFELKWIILVADLPEITEKEFIHRVAGTVEEYLFRCRQSVFAIKSKVDDSVIVQTFSDFYGKVGIDYLSVQNEVAKRIRIEGKIQPFCSKFLRFVYERATLARKFRGRSLSDEEILQAGAHGMSLYVTHGTLLRKLVLGQNLVVINHQTPNLQNFFLCNLAPGYENLINTLKFPLGVLEKKLY